MKRIARALGSDDAARGAFELARRNGAPTALKDIGATIMNDSLTQSVTDSFGNCADARTKEILTALVRHLHAFAREVSLTHDEWRRGIEFLTTTGKKCDGIRQEFILLSDTLGLSIVLDDINQHHDEEAATESSLLGPFYRGGLQESAFARTSCRATTSRCSFMAWCAI